MLSRKGVNILDLGVFSLFQSKENKVKTGNCRKYESSCEFIRDRLYR